MGVKRRLGGEEKQPKMTAQKPPPRRSTSKSPIKAGSSSESWTGVLRSSTSKNSLKIHGSKQDEGSTPSTSKSPERYKLKNITPPSHARRVSMIFNTPGRTPGKTPLRTPFRKPRLRSLGREQAPDFKLAKKQHKDEAKLWKQHLTSFLNKTHKLCNLSSVKNFRYKEKSQRSKYEHFLKNKVQEVYPSPLLTVKLATTACLTLKPDAVDAVKIRIASLVPGVTADKDKMVTVYSAWMIRTSRIHCTDASGVEWFPVMLYSGRELIHHIVIEWLQGTFGCYVTRYGIKQNDLLWVAGVWSGRPCSVISHQNNKDLKVHLTYHINPPSGMITFSPPNTRGKPKLVIKISLADIHHIWESIVDTNCDEMSIDKLQEFLSCMDSLTSELTCLPTSLINLYQLHTPCITLNGDGKVRLTCGRSAAVVLNHLMDIFVQTANYSAFQDILKDAGSGGLKGDSAKEDEVADEKKPK